MRLKNVLACRPDEAITVWKLVSSFKAHLESVLRVWPSTQYQSDPQLLRAEIWMVP
jgi:hypothetical protein